MSFDSSAVSHTLRGYLAGRVSASHLAEAVAAVYYGSREPGDASREALRPIIDVVERVSPGKLRLTAATGSPGFDLASGERHVPQEAEPALRAAVALSLAALPAAGAMAAPQGGVWGRMWHRVRGLFKTP